ncbi:hypothetical protein HKX48_003129 [Thoreauomyces humboldtii]|nr:hypothetical protein HKX48_003129 [Thoreauomyces humboldtii]
MSVALLPVDLLRPSQVRVLLVPIHPIRQETFRKYVEIISEFAVVSTTDLTKPDLTKSQYVQISGVAKYTQQMYEHEGFLHMNYVTFYDREHIPLEEMQPWRQVVAVIGVMHCQQIPSIGDGFKRFQSILTRYPSVLASRCFAFEPTEQQADDTRGCIMIPDDPKKLSFYLMTQMNDLANELLVAFGNMATHAEKRPMINGPMMSSPIGALVTSAAPSPMVASSPFSPGGAQSASTQSPHNISGGLPSATRENSIATLVSQDSTASMLGSLFAPDKTKKRTPARAQKIVGDLFLLAGRIDLAISSYLVAMEAMKAASDYQWQAATMESYYCALILSVLPKTGVWPPSEGSDQNTPESDEDLPASLTRQPIKPPTYRTLFQAARSHPQFRMLICDIPERYREIVSLYERSYQAGQPGNYPYMQIQGCLFMSKFLAAMWRCKFNGPITNGAGVLLFTPESKGIADIASNMGLQSARTGGTTGNTTGAGSIPGPASDKDRIILHGGLGASRVDVSSWAMKGWASGIEFLTLSDQIRCVTAITTAYALVGHKKKHGFFLRQTALLLAANIRGSSRPAGRMGSLPEISETETLPPIATPEAAGLLECMRNVCAAYGAGRTPSLDERINQEAGREGPKAVFDDDDESWVDDYFDEQDLDAPIEEASTRRIRKSRVKHGWPDLQIDCLKEFVDIADACGAHHDVVARGLRLLQRLHRHLSEMEQTDVMESLKAASINHTIPPLAPADSCRVPIVRRIEIVRQGLTEIPYPHPRSLLDGGVAADSTQAKDPFLYNPFADKGKIAKKDLGKSVLLVAKETAFFDVTFANPFLFALEIEDLQIDTSELDFKPILQQAVTIPASSRTFTVRLAGVPLVPGTLCVKGIRAKLFGGLEVQIGCLTQLLEIPRMRTKDGRRRPQDEAQRFGKWVEGKTPANKDEIPKTQPLWHIPIAVIPAQPALQIVQDAAAPTSRMLFAGECTSFPVRLENIGNTHIDLITVGLLEAYAETERVLSPEAQEEPEDVYERDVYWRNVRSLWVEKDPFGHERVGPVMGDVVVERIALDLPPGGVMEIMIGVYGKMGCTGGTITISYASTALDPDIDIATPPTTFYTRTLIQPVLLTVARSLHPVNMDTMLLTDRHDFSGDNSGRDQSNDRNLSIEEMTVDLDLELNMGAREDYYLFVLDMRNFWRGVFEVVFEVYDDPDSLKPTYETRTVVHAGVTKRIHLPMKRLHLPASQVSKRIPEPEWKQFVVGKTRKRPPEEERERRVWFWYRQEVLRRVRVRWTASGRQGVVGLRALKLAREMGQVVRRCAMGVDVQVHGVTLGAEGTWPVKMWEKTVVVWTITNFLAAHPHPSNPGPTAPSAIITISHRLIATILIIDVNIN